MRKKGESLQAVDGSLKKIAAMNKSGMQDLDAKKVQRTPLIYGRFRLIFVSGQINPGFNYSEIKLKKFL